MVSVVVQPDPAARRTRRSIVRSWLGQETFWRDVTTRTLAAAIVGLGAYLYALGAGYIRTPSGAQAIRGVWNVGVTVGVIVLILVGQFWAMFHDPKKYADKPRWQRTGVRVLWWTVAMFCGLGVFHAMTGVFNDVWWAWPFNTPRFHVPMANEHH